MKNIAIFFGWIGLDKDKNTNGPSIGAKYLLQGLLKYSKYNDNIDFYTKSCYDQDIKHNLKRYTYNDITMEFINKYEIIHVVNDIQTALIISNFTDNIILGPNVIFSYPCTNIKRKISKFPYLKEKILLEEELCNKQFNVILICNNDLLHLYEKRIKKYNKILSFPYGVNTEVFQPNTKINREFITSVVPSDKKGLSLLTKARKLLPEELQSKWIFYDEINKYEHGSEKHLNILQTTKIFVSGSAYETQGLASFEALSCGCPVIICDYTYKRDNDDNISIFEPVYFNSNMSIIVKRDPNLIAEKIIELFNDNEKINEMSIVSRKYIVDNFSLEIMSNNYDKIIDTI